MFEQVKGLHDDAAGLTIVGGFNSGDPEVMFEEHGLGKGCEYFELFLMGCSTNPTGHELAAPTFVRERTTMT